MVLQARGLWQRCSPARGGNLTSLRSGSTALAGKRTGQARLDDLVRLLLFRQFTLVLRPTEQPRAIQASAEHPRPGAVHPTFWAAYGHQDLPFERLVEVLKPPGTRIASRGKVPCFRNYAWKFHKQRRQLIYDCPALQVAFDPGEHGEWGGQVSTLGVFKPGRAARRLDGTPPASASRPCLGLYYGDRPYFRKPV